MLIFRIYELNDCLMEGYEIFIIIIMVLVPVFIGIGLVYIQRLRSCKQWFCSRFCDLDRTDEKQLYVRENTFSSYASSDIEIVEAESHM